MSTLLCRYCDREATFSPTSAHRYHGRDLGPIWECIPCGAYVGCHPRSKRPLGCVASAETRALRVAAHAAFDPLWRAKMRRDGCSQSEARTAAYRWLSECLGIAMKHCHMSMMDDDLLRAAAAICRDPSRWNQRPA